MRFSLIGILFFAASFLVQAQPNLAKLDRDCRLALDSFAVPGFAIGIIKDGEIVLARGYGLRQKGESARVDENTIFAIASNTKAFTATALAMLAEEGKMNLDDRVRTHLPHFKMYDPYVSEHLNLRDLLSHRAGLGTFSGDVSWFKSKKPASEIVNQIQYVPQAYEFRAGYGYSNLMFITAGEVLGAVAGMPWSQYFRQHIFQPLDMQRTFTSVHDLSSVDNVASPHISRNDNEVIAYVDWDNMGAAGGMLSSVTDMLQWIQAQLAADNSPDASLITEAMLAETWKPHNPIGGSTNFLSYGLGYFLYELEGERIVTHGGGYDGMYSRVTMAPDLDLGIVVLTNSMTGLSSRLATHVLRSYLSLSAEDWLAKGAAAERSNKSSWETRRQQRVNARQKNTQPTLIIADMVGTYADPMYGSITVSRVGDKLSLRFDQAPGLDADLSHWHHDVYRLDWKESNAWFDFGTVAFLTDNNGKVTGLRFDVPNDDIFFDEIKATKVETDQTK